MITTPKFKNFQTILIESNKYKLSAFFVITLQAHT